MLMVFGIGVCAAFCLPSLIERRQREQDMGDLSLDLSGWIAELKAKLRSMPPP